MKIVFNTFFREKMGGGAGRVPYEIVDAFAKKHQVLFVRPGGLTCLKDKNKRLAVLNVGSKGEGEVAIPILDRSNVDYIFKTLENFSPDIIHVHDPGPVAFLLQIWAKENNVPFIYTSHVLPTKTSDFGTKELSKYVGKLLDSGILKKYILDFFKNCDGVIALNNSAQKDIGKLGYPGKVFIVPNGRNLKLYNRFKFANLSVKTKKLIFIGYLSQRKNQKFLLDVMGYLPNNFKLILVGKALEEGYLEELKSYVQYKGLKNVVFAGEVDHQKIPRYLKESHIFVSASKMEVQSLVVLEALAAGKPVIGLSNETIDEFIDNAAGYNLPKNCSPKKFADKVQEICSLPQEKYEQMCASARGKVSHLDWKNVVELTAGVYKTFTVSHKGPDRKHLRRGREDMLEKLSEIFDLKNILPQKHQEFKNDLCLFSLILLTSLGGSFYSLLETSRNLKTQPIDYLSKAAKKFLIKPLDKL
jgi:1,2-diacylglycerol 3-alpha-glucosyltransferase